MEETLTANTQEKKERGTEGEQIKKKEKVTKTEREQRKEGRKSKQTKNIWSCMLRMLATYCVIQKHSGWTSNEQETQLYCV